MGIRHIPGNIRRWIDAWFAESTHVAAIIAALGYTPANAEDAMTGANIAELDDGTPDHTDLVAFVAYTAAISRVLQGVCSTAGTADKIINIGGLHGVVGSDFSAGADAAGFAVSIAAYITAHLASVPCLSAVVNTPGIVDITFLPGVNTLPVTTDDPGLLLGDDLVTGQDAIELLQKATPGRLSVMEFLAVGGNLEINYDNAETYRGLTLRLTGAAVLTFKGTLPDGFWCNVKETTGAAQSILADGGYATMPDSWTGVKANGLVTFFMYGGLAEIVGQGVIA